MASEQEPEILPTRDSNDELEPSRFLKDEGKPTSRLRRLVQHRYFGVFVAFSIIFHVGLVWLLQSFDLPTNKPEPKITEIPVDLVTEAQAQKGGAGQGGGKESGSDEKGSDAKGSDAKTETPAQQNPPSGTGDKSDPKASTAKQDMPPDKSSETDKASEETKPSPPAEDKASEQVQKPQAAAPESQQPIQTAKQDQQPPQASLRYTLPTFVNQPNDRLSLAIPAPLPTDDADAEPISYKLIVFGMLERVKQYPQAARERHAMGHAVIAFSVDDSGQPQNLSLVRSSGETDLDAESLSMVTRAAPFPVPPVGAQRDFAVDIGFGGQ